MTIDNFMLLDLAESLLGVLLFPIILVFPGFLVGWTLNLLSLRESLLDHPFIHKRWAVGFNCPNLRLPADSKRPR